MNTTVQVRFWEIQHKKSRPRRPYGVRWITATQEHSEWFANKTQASSRRSELMRAAKRGEEFDIETGLPVSELKQRNSVSFVAFCQSYVDVKWPNAAAKSRASIVDALATAAAAMMRDGAGRPNASDLRRVLISRLLPPAGREVDMSEGDRVVADWILRQSRPLMDLNEAKTVRALQALWPILLRSMSC
jgi:hypothetical protein